MMIEVREATGDDVPEIREIFTASYGDYYAYPHYYDTQSLIKLVCADGTVLLVAVDRDSKRVVGTASVVFGIGAYNDLVGEFGRPLPLLRFRGFVINLERGHDEFGKLARWWHKSTRYMLAIDVRTSGARNRIIACGGRRNAHNGIG